MLLMPNRKKVASVIVAGMKRGGDKKPDFVQKLGEESGTGDFKAPEPEDDDVDVGLEAAMDEFLSAVEAKDAKGMARALKSAVSMCAHEDAPAEEG